MIDAGVIPALSGKISLLAISTKYSLHLLFSFNVIGRM